jgi:hypothetical protein
VRGDGNVYAMLAVRFVQRILAEREFVASDCLNWHGDETAFAWSDVQMMLTMLKREGLIDDAAVV